MYPPRLVRFSNSQRLFKFVANVAGVQNCFPRPGGHIQISICLIIKLTFGFSSSYVVVIVSRGRMPVTVNTRVPVYVGERRSIYRQRERRSRTCSVASNEYLQFTVQQIQEHVQWTPLQSVCVRACVRACVCIRGWGEDLFFWGQLVTIQGKDHLLLAEVQQEPNSITWNQEKRKRNPKDRKQAWDWAWARNTPLLSHPEGNAMGC